MDEAEEAVGYDKESRIYKKWMVDPQVRNVVSVIRKNTTQSPSGEPMLLDVGCGTARVPIGVAQKVTQCKIWALDLSENMLKVASGNIKEKGLEERISLVEADGENIPFQDNFFDVVMCSNMLHHQRDPGPLRARQRQGSRSAPPVRVVRR